MAGISQHSAAPVSGEPYLVVLGIAQDGGVPQAGSWDDPAWNDPQLRRLVSCLGLVDPASAQCWMFDATPDFPEQLHRLCLDSRQTTSAGLSGPPRLSGIFLTHAHIGHYTGLMYLGHEAMGARDIPVYAMPRLKQLLQTNAPWGQLVRYRNIELRELEADQPVQLTESITVTPFAVPHRDEYSEAVGYRICGRRRAVLYLPDIDSWEQWDAMGVRIEDILSQVDIAYLDGTFFSSDELPGRDMAEFPHPTITHTMRRLELLPWAQRAKVRFIHLNHTNPALRADSAARRTICELGFAVAEQMQLTVL